MNILWNVYHYYAQFSEAVATRIRDLRSPIEKKLKDCVKIFRWDDISHWAIKEAIKKVHKTLHKHIKEFQVSIRSYLSPSTCASGYY
jgi:midasin